MNRLGHMNKNQMKYQMKYQVKPNSGSVENEEQFQEISLIIIEERSRKLNN